MIVKILFAALAIITLLLFAILAVPFSVLFILIRKHVIGIIKFAD